MPSVSAFVFVLCSATLSAAVLAQTLPTSSPQQATCDAACQDAKKAAEAANAAATVAKNAADTANSAARNANVASGSAEDAASQARQAAKDAVGAAAKTNSVIDAARKAAANHASVRRGNAKKSTIDDYVPCVFDEPERYALRALPDPEETPLNPAAANLVANTAQRTAAALGSAAQTESATPDEKTKLAESNWNVKAFASDLKPEHFVGVLPKDVSTVIKALASQYGVPEALANPVSNSAEKALSSAFTRPEDVSCSFSILQWHETSDTFGRRVANDYVGIEVNVRNLNATTEFLIHDIQIAVDTGLDPIQFGRFQAARDKLVVRNVAQKGQSEDARNRVINLLLLMGAIAGPASGALTQGNANSDAAGNVATAVSIFQGPFMAGLTAMFPDHTLEHINHINDLAFSASSTSKTVVPIQGSVPLITFLPEKPLEQLPFAQCGKNVRRWFFDISESSDSPGSSQYRYCNFEEQATASDQPNYYMRPLHFHRWSPAAIEVLQRRVFVVIAGVHIQELTNSPRVDRVSCPPGNDENVDLTKADSSGTVTCTLHGNNLTKASAIKLEQQDAKTIPGTLTSTDSQTATMTFKTADASGAKGKYELFVADTPNTDVDTKQFLNFGSPITITKVSCQPGTDANLDLSKTDGSTAINCTLTGTNLGQASFFKLDQLKAQTIWPTTKASSDGNSTTLTFSPDANLKKASGSYEVWFTDANGKTVDSGQKITFTSKPST